MLVDLAAISPPVCRRTPLLRRMGHACLALSLLSLCPTAWATQDYRALLDRLTVHPAVRLNDAAARQWVQQADGAMGLPNPSITLGMNNLPVSSPGSFNQYLPSSRSLEFMQPIPNPAGRQARRDTYLNRAGLSTLEQAQIVAQLEQRLLSALAERHAIAASLAALDRQLGLIDDLESGLRGELEGGSAVYGKLDELAIQRSKLAELRITLQGDDRRWQAELQELVGEAVTLPPPDIKPRPWDGSPGQLLAIRIADQKLAVAQGQSNEMRTALKPDYAVGLAWQQREEGDNFDGEDWYTLKFTVNVPLWAGSNQRPKLAAAEEEATRVMLERERLLLQQRRDYDTALADYQTADQLLQRLTQRAAQLRDLEASNRRRYEAGESSLEAVLRPAIERAELTREQARQQARRTIAIARVNALLVEE